VLAGEHAVNAAEAGARTRFRPVTMTAVAFIIGVLPLAFATGAGTATRRSIGTTVFGGVLLAKLLGILFVPTLLRPLPRGLTGSCRIGASRADPRPRLRPWEPYQHRSAAIGPTRASDIPACFRHAVSSAAFSSDAGSIISSSTSSWILAPGDTAAVAERGPEVAHRAPPR
jgi:hypothetical protein